MNARSIFRGRPLGLAVAAALALAAPAAWAQCSYTVMGDGTPYALSATPSFGKVPTSLMGTSWMVVGVRQQAGEDWDMMLYQSAAAAPACVSTVLTSSTFGTDVVDFAVGFGLPAGVNEVHPRFSRFSGSSGAIAMARTTALPLVVNAGYRTYAFVSANNLFDTHQADLQAGASYHIGFSPSGAPGTRLLIFQYPGSGTYWAGRPSAIATLTDQGDFTAPATGKYLFVVANDARQTGSYGLSIMTCPTPIALTSGVSVVTPRAYDLWEFTATQPYWAGLALRGVPYTSYHLEMFQAISTDPWPLCGDNFVAGSALGGRVEFVLGDFNLTPTGTLYTQSFDMTSGTRARVEFDGGGTILNPGADMLTVNTDSTDVFRIWDTFLEAGVTYEFYFKPRGANTHLLLMKNATGGPRYSSRGYAEFDVTGCVTYTATVTGYHGLVVVNEDGGTGSYQLGVSAAPCPCPTALATNTPVSTPSPDAYYEFTPTLSYWGAVAVRGLVNTDDWDLTLSSLATGYPSPTCFGPSLGISAAGPAQVDVVLVDYNTTPKTTKFARAHHASAGSATGLIQWNPTDGLLRENDPLVVASMTTSQLVRVYDAYMTAGITYTIDFSPGMAGLTALVFQNSTGGTYAASRSAAAASGTGRFNYTPTTTGYHAIAVVNDGIVNSSFTLRFGRCLLSGALADEVPVATTSGRHTYPFTQTTATWMAVGLRSETADWDIAVASATASNFPACTGAALAFSSTALVPYIDFVVSDFHHAATGGTYYVDARQYDPAPRTSVPLVWSGSAEVIVPNSMSTPTYVLRQGAPLTCFEVSLTAGVTYEIALFAPQADNLSLHVFRNSGSGAYWASRGSAVASVTASSYATTYTAPATDVYGIVVVNDSPTADREFKPLVRHCPAPVALLNATPQSSLYSMFHYFRQPNPYWGAVGVRSVVDWDMRVFQTGTGGGMGSCFTNPLASSTQPSGVDFVVGDFNAGANSTNTDFFLWSYSPAGAVSGTVEASVAAQQAPSSGAPLHRTTSASDLLECFDVMLDAGVTYNVHFAHDGAADLRLFVFENPGGAYWAPRSMRVLEASGHTTYTPAVTGWHGVVVTNENAQAGSYDLGFSQGGLDAGPPVVPAVTALRGVSPNPSRGGTTIEYALHEAAAVRLDVLDMAGRRVATLEEGEQPAGTYRVPWSAVKSAGGAVPPGLYFVRLQVAGRTVGERKVALVQ